MNFIQNLLPLLCLRIIGYLAICPVVPPTQSLHQLNYVDLRILAHLRPNHLSCLFHEGIAPVVMKCLVVRLHFGFSAEEFSIRYLEDLNIAQSSLDVEVFRYNKDDTALRLKTHLSGELGAVCRGPLLEEIFIWAMGDCVMIYSCKLSEPSGNVGILLLTPIKDMTPMNNSNTIKNCAEGFNNILPEIITKSLVKEADDEVPDVDCLPVLMCTRDNNEKDDEKDQQSTQINTFGIILLFLVVILIMFFVSCIAKKYNQIGVFE